VNLPSLVGTLVRLRARAWDTATRRAADLRDGAARRLHVAHIHVHVRAHENRIHARRGIELAAVALKRRCAEAHYLTVRMLSRIIQFVELKGCGVVGKSITG
jgi:hypothetical protein